ncbi:zinc ABC transporter substrate-binding protein [bacterium]|nr:zinc ABC transporter substrate-binding protein [bacterium]
MKQRSFSVRWCWSCVLLLVFPSFLLAAEGSASSEKSSPTVLGTIGMITDVVQQIGGEHLSVTGLIGAGVDPHLYKATRSDIVKLRRADLVFYNGLLLEGKLTDALIRVASSGKRVVAVTEEIDPSFLLQPEEFGGHADPHVWMDPTAWAKGTHVIARTLSELDPPHAESYQQRHAEYLKRLEALDQYAERVLHTVPEPSRVLVTAHDAFGYLGKRYGYQVLGIQGISTESEAGVQDIERLVSVLVERKIRAVFVESTVSQRNVRALIEGAAAQGHTVVVGGELFSDAMGKPGTYEGSYIGMIDHNVTTIASALGGTAPKRGLNGKLSRISLSS